MTDHKFTDEEIIKALEICPKAKCWGDCEDMGCPAASRHGCRFYLRTDEDYDGVIQDEMLKDALDLINRQKAEISILNVQLAASGLAKNELQHEINRQKEEIEEQDQAIIKALKRIGEIRAEAYKEFAERLCEGRVSNDLVVIAASCLLKEMTEEKNR